MKIAVIFIGTGQYLNFLPSWYNSCQKNLCPEIIKHYFCFTDGEISDVPDNIKIYHQEHLDWPYVTLLRFDIILKAKENLLEYDWILFLDADMEVYSRVDYHEIFNNNKKYIGVHHPCHYMNLPPHNEYPGAFEINKQSLSCISELDDISIYYQGCLWGGKVPYVIDMMEILSKNINLDLKNDIISLWHDESHLNKYFSDKDIKKDVNTLSSSYAFPEDFEKYCNFPKKIVHLSKNNKEYHA